MATAKDAVLDAAVDLAREAAADGRRGPALVGEHLGRVAEGERLVHTASPRPPPGYLGWAWTVTLARVPRGRTATVSEVDLLPGEGALLAPAWVPWSERLRPGDLGPGDVLPYQERRRAARPGLRGHRRRGRRRLAISSWASAGRGCSPRRAAQAAERWYAGRTGRWRRRPSRPARRARPAGSCCSGRLAAHRVRGLRQRVVAGRRSRGEHGPRLRRALRDRPRAAAERVAGRCPPASRRGRRSSSWTCDGR